MLLFNYSGSEVSFKYAYRAGNDLLAGRSVTVGDKLNLAPWDLAINEEKAK